MFIKIPAETKKGKQKRTSGERMPLSKLHQRAKVRPEMIHQLSSSASSYDLRRKLPKKGSGDQCNSHTRSQRAPSHNHLLSFLNNRFNASLLESQEGRRPA